MEPAGGSNKKVLQNTGKFVAESRTEGYKQFLLFYNFMKLFSIQLYRDDYFNEAGYRQSRENDKIDSKYGFDRVKDGLERTGYLINMHTVSIIFYSIVMQSNASLL